MCISSEPLNIRLDSTSQTQHTRELQSIDPKCYNTFRTANVEDNINDIVYNVGDAYQTIDVPLYIDYVSFLFGGGNIEYCGTREIGIAENTVTYQNYLELRADDRQLIVGTDNNGDVGTYQLTIIDYVNTNRLEEFILNVDILGCKVTAFSYTAPNSIYSGTVPDDDMEIVISAWSVVPSRCDTEAEFTA